MFCQSTFPSSLITFYFKYPQISSSFLNKNNKKAEKLCENSIFRGLHSFQHKNKIIIIINMAQNHSRAYASMTTTTEVTTKSYRKRKRKTVKDIIISIIYYKSTRGKIISFSVIFLLDFFLHLRTFCRGATDF